MSTPTDEERRTAKLHATAWEDAFHSASANADRRRDIDQTVMRTLASFAMGVASGYRKIANGNDIED